MIKKIVYILTVALVVVGMLATTTPALAHSGGGKVAGTLAAVDTTASTVTITPKSGGADVVLKVDASTSIKRNKRLVTLADLQVGDKVEAKYDPATMLASKIEAKFKVAKVKGTISAVDTTVSTVTVTPKSGGADVVLNVNASTWIKRSGHTAVLADLQVGDKVDAWYDATTLLASKIFAKLNQAELHGTVAAVDTAASTVTVTRTKGGTSVTLNVDASTLIKRNNLPATLADLQVGDKVEAKYNPVTMLAYRIEAKVKMAELHGVITAVDTTANTVTVKPARGGADVVLTVDASTLIKRNHLTATLADLKVGDKVEAKFNRATMLASQIKAKG